MSYALRLDHLVTRGEAFIEESILPVDEKLNHHSGLFAQGPHEQFIDSRRIVGDFPFEVHFFSIY